MQLLTPELLAHVQLCDVAGVPRELATDADRILPGDGDFQLGAIIDAVRRLGYQGWISLELMNPLIWDMPGSRVAEMGMKALCRMLQEG